MDRPDAEHALLLAGFGCLRPKGSHRIYGKGHFRVNVPFHDGARVVLNAVGLENAFTSANSWPVAHTVGITWANHE